MGNSDTSESDLTPIFAPIVASEKNSTAGKYTLDLNYFKAPEE